MTRGTGSLGVARKMKLIKNMLLTLSLRKNRMDSYNFRKQYTSFPKWNNPVSLQIHYINMVKFHLPAKLPWSIEERIFLLSLPPRPCNMEAMATSSNTACLTGSCIVSGLGHRRSGAGKAPVMCTHERKSLWPWLTRPESRAVSGRAWPVVKCQVFAPAPLPVLTEILF